jgi:hypothetical protein
MHFRLPSFFLVKSSVKNGRHIPISEQSVPDCARQYLVGVDRLEMDWA